MSKAVLISIQPKWCELIASGKKTIEVRKTCPKLETPFKCYIYATNPKSKNDLGLCLDKGDFGNLKEVGLVYKCNYEAAKMLNMQILSGKVIGEFVCDEITEFYPTMDLKQLTSVHFQMCEKSCVDMEDLHNYANDKILYGWHISDLVIYDNPRALCTFNHPHYKDCDIECGKCKYGFPTSECLVDEYICDRELQRPPQSWFYVEELNE